ncbi:dihydroxyacetone kinase subunit DhaL [Vallitalea guaymasensis]|uniref:phosphoenolpyruvate--glycerone phosphotransferase n=1 Tax=Vallitalea guaymasensis TaxID=1185412 RepID=A0A8J8SDE6_9FIRM|nr:dihydroxyacetone kinase subunit DhaL [Vallitalea guaymasensis]QUH30654.1 dihydroxyacetone kinase subunit L [Vallitalea guaymasensis]
MAYILNKNSSIIVDNLIETIINNTEYLSEIDGAIGDGDHGINMNKGFSICKTRLADKEVNLAEALKTLGLVLMMEIGGSMGPLYGTFFVEMSKVISDKEEIDKDVFGKMLNAALKGLQSLGNAKVGDKTMMDTLVPAVVKFDKEIGEGKSFVEALQAMKTAAEKGKDSTKDLVAKVGRASRLGERSRGVLDAGAVSCNLILACIIDSVIELIEDM